MTGRVGRWLGWWGGGNDGWDGGEEGMMAGRVGRRE